MGLLGVLGVKMWKYCVLTPKMHYPAWIRICWCIACQNWFSDLSSRSVERFCVQRKKFKKLGGNFGYMGRSNPLGNLGQMWHVVRYDRHDHVCNIWWLSVKGCGCGERGYFAFSHWFEVSPLQHWSPCDHVIEVTNVGMCKTYSYECNVLLQYTYTPTAQLISLDGYSDVNTHTQVWLVKRCVVTPSATIRSGTTAVFHL